jgi:hypothetical protein
MGKPAAAARFGKHAFGPEPSAAQNTAAHQGDMMTMDAIVAKVLAYRYDKLTAVDHISGFPCPGSH